MEHPAILSVRLLAPAAAAVALLAGGGIRQLSEGDAPLPPKLIAALQKRLDTITFAH